MSEITHQDPKYVKSLNPCFKYSFEIIDVLSSNDYRIILNIKLKKDKRSNLNISNSSNIFTLKIQTQSSGLYYTQDLDKISEITKHMGDISIGPKVLDSYICNRGQKRTLFILMEKVDSVMDNILDVAIMTNSQNNLLNKKINEKVKKIGSYFIHDDLNFYNIGFIKNVKKGGVVCEPYIIDFTKILFSSKNTPTGIDDYDKNLLLMKKEFDNIFTNYNKLVNTLKSYSDILTIYKNINSKKSELKILLDKHCKILTIYLDNYLNSSINIENSSKSRNIRSKSRNIRSKSSRNIRSKSSRNTRGKSSRNIRSKSSRNTRSKSSRNTKSKSRNTKSKSRNIKSKSSSNTRGKSSRNTRSKTDGNIYMEKLIIIDGEIDKIYEYFSKKYKSIFLSIDKIKKKSGCKIYSFKKPSGSYKLCDVTSDRSIDFRKHQDIYNKTYKHFDEVYEDLTFFEVEFMRSDIVNMIYFENKGRSKNPKYIMY